MNNKNKKLRPNEGLFRDIIVYKPDRFKDKRGYFSEIFNYEKCNRNFVQDNVSFSKRNTIRGLHFQLPPFQQGKLIHVLKGKILDVQVNIEKFGPYFGMWQKETLKEGDSIYIPPGYAHGFLAQEDSLILYKCTNYYSKPDEVTLLWNDPDIGIDWKIKNPIISNKDKNGIRFKDL